MKKSLLFIVILFLLFGCQNQNTASSLHLSEIEDINLQDDVVLLLNEEDSNLPTEITINYINNSANEYIYGGIDILEMQIDRKWYTIPPADNVQWHMLAYKLEANSVAESNFQIAFYYGDLEAGKYRVVKEIRKYDNVEEKFYIAAEFDISATEN